MEDFYRRKYLSPTYTKVSAYLDAVEKDRTISELRKQIIECKTMEAKFDELCFQIAQVEKENKNLEEENAKIQNQYLEKIKKNKQIITELKNRIGDCNDNSEHKDARLAKVEKENQSLLEELKKIRKEAEENLKEKEAIQLRISQQKQLKQEFEQSLKNLKEKKQEFKLNNALQAKEIEQKYEVYKIKQKQLSDEEKNEEFLKKQLENLIEKRIKLQSLNEISQGKLKYLSSNLQIQSRQTEDSKAKCDEAVEKTEVQQEQSFKISKDLKKTLLKNKQNSLRLKSLEQILMQTTKTYNSDKNYLQKMELRQIQLHKHNQKLEQMLKNINDVLSDQQQAYTRIIQHMKQSIVQDEKAIDNLNKQAQMLQGMIN